MMVAMVREQNNATKARNCYKDANGKENSDLKKYVTETYARSTRVTE